ncbi:MAG: hypothetical protein JW739_05815 [Opitutales bacterium]|nr:hypothetical protein [Opitutales bacterium]
MPLAPEKHFKSLLYDEIKSLDRPVSDDEIRNICLHLFECYSSSYTQLLEGKHLDKIESQKEMNFRFCEQNYKRWRPAFDLLHIIISISIETGSIFCDNFKIKVNEENRVLFDVMLRLHARACMTANEVLCLLESGFPDGAFARWRALHEIAVIGLFIVARGNECAKSYRDHAAIGKYLHMKAHDSYKLKLKAPGPTEEQLENAERRFKILKERYGKGFDKDYGWAGPFLGLKDNNNVRFNEIEKVVKLDQMRPYYRWASQVVHPCSTGTYEQMGLLETDEDIILTGRSDGGMIVPSHSLAISLSQVVLALLRVDNNLEIYMSMTVLDHLNEKLGEELHRC